MADLVFPLFLWMASLSMSIYLSGLPALCARSFPACCGAPACSLPGLLLNNGANLAQWRILCVLQYFAMSNLLVGVVDIFVPVPASLAPAADGGGWHLFAQARSGLLVGRSPVALGMRPPAWPPP